MDHQSARQKSEKHKKDWKIRQKIVFRFSSDSACSLRMAMDEIESRCQATVTDRSVCLPSPGLIYQDGKVSQAFNFIIATHAARFRASHETITSSRVEPTPLEATPDSRKFNFRAQNNRQERSRKLESRGSDGKSNPIKISNYFVVNTFSEAKIFLLPQLRSTNPKHNINLITRKYCVISFAVFTSITTKKNPSETRRNCACRNCFRLSDFSRLHFKLDRLKLIHGRFEKQRSVLGMDLMGDRWAKGSSFGGRRCG